MPECKEKYSDIILEGAEAAVESMLDDSSADRLCPYSRAEIGKRSAWMAGWHDKKKDLGNR
jgi:hypothetical protein